MNRNNNQGTIAKGINTLNKSKVNKDDLDLGNGAINQVDLIDIDQDDIGNEENAMIQQRYY